MIENNEPKSGPRIDGLVQHVTDTTPQAREVDRASTEATPDELLPAAGETTRADERQAFQEAVRERIRPEQFETWFRRASLRHCGADLVEVTVQNDFARGWLESHYMDELTEAARMVFGAGVRVGVSVDPELTIARAEARTPTLPEGGAQDQAMVHKSAPPTSGRPGPRPGERPGQRPGALLWNSDVVLNEKYTFDKFVVGPCNRFAHAAAKGAGEQPGVYNPFFLHGSVGLGKTHLLQSICFSILEGWPDSRILYLSCETFVNHFIHALQEGDLEEFRHKYRNVDVLVVDDIHLLANKERTQEEFFHTFNTLYNAGKQIVLSSDSPPIEIPTLQERLVSRFKWGMITEIEKPCFETRMAIVMRKGLERGHEVPDPVAKLIAERIETNVRELEGAVTRLLGYASLTKQEVTIDLARVALRDLFIVRRGQPTMDDIARVITDHYRVKLVDLQSKSRTNSIVFPRQVAMFIARRITKLSLGEIGGYFGGRDHSTVLHANDKITKLVQKDRAVHETVDGLLASLDSSAI